jgi:hypothetical protein
VKVGDVVRLYRLNDDYVTREPTERIGLVASFSNWTKDVFVFMDGKQERFHPDALRIISAAARGTG